VPHSGEGRCRHCAEALPALPVTLSQDGGLRHYCCQGCAAAAQWVADARLDDYYRLRTSPAGRPDPSRDYRAWDRIDVQQGHVRTVPGGCEITLVTDGMRCAACAWLIDSALRREAGVLDAGANAVTGRIRLRWNPEVTTLSRLLERLGALGYRTGLAQGEARERQRRQERNRWLMRLGIAGLGSLQAMMFAEALYLDTAGAMPLATRDFFRWLTFLVATPVVFYAGWPFLHGAWRELRARAPGMDTLVASGSLLAWAGSLVETLRGGPQVWYDAAVMFVFFLLAARLLEQGARSAATAQVDALARAQPALAQRECADGSLETVATAALRPGDIVHVASGETLPADGLLLDAPAPLAEALLTGESIPRWRQPGDTLHAGTLCPDRPLRLQVDCVGVETRLSQLSRLVEAAQAHRPPLALLADRIARRFVTVLVLVAAAVGGTWWLREPDRAFEVTLALLVISCPCALSLSVPAALAAAHASLARMGLLVTRPAALEQLARATDVVFDKTGTLSCGEPASLTVDVAPDAADGLTPARALAIAAALERGSHHPLARAFRRFDEGLAISGVVEHAGQGIEGLVDGQRWRLGQAGFVGATTVPTMGHGDEAIWLGATGRGQAAFQWVDPPRPETAAVVQALADRGLALHLFSGDSTQRVSRFAAELGIAGALGRMSPEDKLARVRQLQAEGRCVAMVGDGLNDAPVLAGADVSIAVAGSAALARRSADLVLVGHSLWRIPQAIGLAQRTRRIIRQNLAWAVGYNLLALPLAAAGWVTPWLAALAMVVSSLTVTLNALRLARRLPELHA
jgi:P-type Cu2+ transporter